MKLIAALLLLSSPLFANEKPTTIPKTTAYKGDWTKFAETKTWAEVVKFLDANPSPAEIEEKFGKPHMTGSGDGYTTMEYFTVHHKFPDKETNGLVIVIRGGKISQYGAYEKPKGQPPKK